MITRRRAISGIVSGLIATPAVWTMSRRAHAQAKVLKLSHQFPAAATDEGDFRDLLCKRFGAELEKRTKGALTAQVYAGSSLVKPNSQISQLRKAALDMSLCPVSYAGGEMPELNIGFMPAIIASYDQGYAWKKAEIGKEFTNFLLDRGVVLVTWVWQGGGIASRVAPIINPDDVKGLKVRGGSREMDLVLKGAGAAVISLPSTELYAAMQTGAMEVAMTTSTSLLSFRLEELTKNVTTSRKAGFYFVLEPILMSKTIFDALPKDQQDAILTSGAAIEDWGRQRAQADDQVLAKVYAAKGVGVFDLDQNAADKWKTIARESAWKDYGTKTPLCGKLLKLAEQVAA